MERFTSGEGEDNEETWDYARRYPLRTLALAAGAVSIALVTTVANRQRARVRDA
jgi:hypothetical protein